MKAWSKENQEDKPLGVENLPNVEGTENSENEDEPIKEVESEDDFAG